MSSYPVNWITDYLGVGYAPMSYAELEEIKAQGIDAIVNLCAEFSDLHTLEESAGFEVFYLPVWDEDVPEIKEMEKALAWLDEAVYLGKKVLVHCRHGIGRTGTFVTSYLIRRGIGLKAAEKKLKPSSAKPSNYSQWQLLKKYGKASGTLTIREPSLEMKNRVDLSLFFSGYDTLIKKIDTEGGLPLAESGESCGKGLHTCCFEPFDLQFIEVIYLHSKMNKHFRSAQREALIERTIEFSKKKSSLCPFNNGSGCEIYQRRPARCRSYGMLKGLADKQEIKDVLLDLSRSVFLAFSGRFLPDTGFTFSAAETISGKFVQRFFHYMIDAEKQSL